MRASVAEAVTGESGQVFGDSAAIRLLAGAADMEGSVGSVGDDAVTLAALPLVKRSADRDRHVQVALVDATLAIAGGIIHPGGNTAARSQVS